MAEATVIDTSDDIVAGEDTGGWFDAAMAILLGIAAIAAAWSAFQSGSLGGDSLTLQNQSIKTSDEASQQFTDGTQQTAGDTALFLEYAKAVQEDNTDLADYLKTSLMEDNLVKAVDAWEAAPDTEDSPASPLDTDEYVVAGYDEGERLDDKSLEQSEKASDLGSRSGKFDFATVLLAVALFMFGIASVFRVRFVRIGAAGAGIFVLVLALIRIIDLGYYKG